VTVGWGTGVPARSSQVRSPIVSLEFFIDITLPAALWPWGRLTLKQKWVPWIFAWGGGGRRPVHRADNLTTFMCWMSWNLGASTSWNPQVLSSPVMELLYLFTCNESEFEGQWHFDYDYLLSCWSVFTKVTTFTLECKDSTLQTISTSALAGGWKVSNREEVP
jgi:hypothetical protein